MRDEEGAGKEQEDGNHADCLESAQRNTHRCSAHLEVPHQSSHRHVDNQTSSPSPTTKLRTFPFAGRLGGNLATAVDRRDERNAALLSTDPDAAPGIPLGQQLSLRQFQSPALWRASFVEGVGSMLLNFVTIWANISPNRLPTMPTQRLGYFDNAAYLGPLTGGLSNFVLISLFTFAFGPVTGAHLNPMITIATFCARLCTLPRMILYISFQLLGVTVAGLLVRAAYGSRDFKVGGCWLFEDVVPVQDAFVVEFMATTTLVFIAFGVGLDPRQHKVISPSLSPFLVGLTLAVISWATGYTRYGYGGASMNPARCFGTMVGSHFQSWHWIHWVADICACIFHGIVYELVPPGLSQV